MATAPADSDIVAGHPDTAVSDTRLAMPLTTVSADTTAPETTVNDFSAAHDTVAVPTPQPDSVPTDSIIAADSLSIRQRSPLQRHTASLADSTRRRPSLGRTRINPTNTGRDSTRIVRTKVDLDNAVDFSAKDSMIMTGRNTAYM